MKAVIPVAGVGSRLRPHTYTQPKALIPVAGKPILAHIVDQLREENIEEFIFIIGYLGEKIQVYIQERYPDLDVQFVVQDQRLGLGHAIYEAREAVGNEPLFIMLGDTIIDDELPRLIECKTSAVGIKEVDQPGQFGVALVDNDMHLTGAIEKPRIPKTNLALVGAYKINETEVLMECLKELIAEGKPEDGEFHLTDAIDRFVSKKNQVVTGVLVDRWYDLGKRDVLLETNAILLRKQNLPVNEKQAKNSILIPPVYIAPGAEITNSIIGPNVTIGENTQVRESIVQESIIGNYSQITQISLQRSIIGSDAILHGHVNSLNIGDNTEIDLSQAGS